MVYIKFRIFLILIAVITLEACIKSDDNFDWYVCINSEQQPMSAQTLDGIGILRQKLYASSKKLWGQIDTTKPDFLSPPAAIHVCWEESAYASPAYGTSRATVQRAIEESWQKALDVPGISPQKKIRFYGWQKCQSGCFGFGVICPPNDDWKGVRIGVSDERPYVLDLGSDLQGVFNGVILNFDFNKWASKYCRKNGKANQECIYKIAIHEFGHALGIAHEQNRPDTDRQTCKDAPQGESGDLMIGAWDPDSVMNYCNARWNNNGRLSIGDVYGIQIAYYPTYFSTSCGITESANAVPLSKEFNIRRTPAVNSSTIIKIIPSDIQESESQSTSRAPTAHPAK